MLRSTFCHVPGIGSTTEASLWQQGCTTWDAYLADPGAYRVGTADRGLVRDVVTWSAEALAKRDHRFFSEALGLTNAWRAWEEFQDRTLYLDIETDGGNSGASITMVGLYDGYDFTCLVQGRDLERFPEMMAECGMLVTFFGAGFDVPVLRKAFPQLAYDQIHLDLCPLFKNLGVRGGLKKIERQMGICRSDDTDGLTGRDAIRLWRMHNRGDEEALRVLTAYNKEDVVNMKALARIAYDRSKRGLVAAAGLAAL
ncbi:MAG: ribonuclease H-like domain-containing protein [Fimbriimonadaceae bacterium]|nr:ribonuclease H-like domain-containing protein [Fimbriimonadaceae bacterium]